MLGWDQGEDCCVGRQGRWIGQLRRLCWPDLGVKRLGASGRRTRRGRGSGAGRRTRRGAAVRGGRGGGWGVDCAAVRGADGAAVLEG